jgi:hypothetical protein
MPRAQRLRQVSCEFRQLLRTADCRDVFSQFAAPLSQIFAFYAAKDASLAKAKRSLLTMSEPEFVSVLTDAQLIDSNLNVKQAKFIYAAVQQQAGTVAEPEANSSEMVFVEFQEALAAACNFKICNPYISFVTRLESFIGEMLLPPLAKRMDRGLKGKKKAKKSVKEPEQAAVVASQRLAAEGLSLVTGKVAFDGMARRQNEILDFFA